MSETAYDHQVFQTLNKARGEQSTRCADGNSTAGARRSSGVPRAAGFTIADVASHFVESGDFSAGAEYPADADSDAVSAAIQAHIDTVNEGLARYETIKYFSVVPPMTVEDGLLTASLKVKRKVVYDRYADRIDAMYDKQKPA